MQAVIEELLTQNLTGKGKASNDHLWKTEMGAGVDFDGITQSGMAVAPNDEQLAEH